MGDPLVNSPLLGGVKIFRVGQNRQCLVGLSFSTGVESVTADDIYDRVRYFGMSHDDVVAAALEIELKNS